MQCVLHNDSVAAACYSPTYGAKATNIVMRCGMCSLPSKLDVIFKAESGLPIQVVRLMCPSVTGSREPVRPRRAKSTRGPSY